MLRELRRAAKMSPAEVEQQSGIARQNLSSYEHGARSMGPGVAAKIASAIDEKPAWVMYAAKMAQAQKAVEDNNPSELLTALRDAVLAAEDLDLSDKDRKRLEELIDDALDIAKSTGAKPKAPEDSADEGAANDDDDLEDDKDAAKKSRGRAAALKAEGVDPETGRDFYGRRASKNLFPSENLQPVERDAFGRRVNYPAAEVAPFAFDDAVENPDGEIERDLYGRRVRSN